MWSLQDTHLLGAEVRKMNPITSIFNKLTYFGGWITPRFYEDKDPEPVSNNPVWLLEVKLWTPATSELIYLPYGPSAIQKHWEKLNFKLSLEISARQGPLHTYCLHEAILIWEVRHFNSTDTAYLSPAGLSAREHPCKYLIGIGAANGILPWPTSLLWTGIN